MGKGTILGGKAASQIGDVVRWWNRTHANDLPATRPQPVIQGSESSIRWGTLTAQLVGQTTVPVLANAIRFDRNTADSGSHGSWVPELDSGGAQLQFKVIENLLPTTKKIPQGKKVCCVQVAPDVWAPIAAECPVNV